MYLVCRLTTLAVFIATAIGVSYGQALRVCADSHNLPYSNDRLQGFENRLAELVARDLGRQLQYVWLPASPRQTEKLQKAGICELMMEVPAHYPILQTTASYYTSSYVFVTRKDRHLMLRSLDDPFLKVARIGLHGVGDGSAIPPAHELANRDIVRNVAVYSIFGNLAEQNPAARLIEAVAAGDLDVAIAWGPLAGYFAAHSAVPLTVSAICPGKNSVMPLSFAMSIGVRRGDDVLYRQMEAELARRSNDFRAVLQDYGVPIVDTEAQGTTCE